MHWCTVILIFAAFFAKEVSSRTCPDPRKMKPQIKCKGDNCIPRVKGTNIDWDSVTTTSFEVRWQPEPKARCYYIELLNSYTIHVLKDIKCFKGTIYEFTELKPWTIYGVRVSVLTNDCRRGRHGVPARSRTRWMLTTTQKTTTRAGPTPEPGKCGRNKFTCASNVNACIPAKKWCNKRLDCDDKSDERGCPGGCEEIDIDFKNGNYSCTRWGSPGSVCLFDCKSPHVRDGNRHTWCDAEERRWTHPIPTCRLPAAKKLEMIQKSATSTSLTVEWSPVEGAVRYSFLAVEVTPEEDKDEALMRMKSVEAEDCCSGTITDLKPGAEFEVVMRAVDDSDVDGKKSDPVFGRTREGKEEATEEGEI